MFDEAFEHLESAVQSTQDFLANLAFAAWPWRKRIAMAIGRIQDALTESWTALGSSAAGTNGSNWL